MVRRTTVGVFQDLGVGANRSRQCLVEPPIYSLAIVAEVQKIGAEGYRVLGGPGCCLCPMLEIILNQMLPAAVF